MEITLLSKEHNRKDFKCEEVSLTDYLLNQVSQDIKKRLANCFVAVDKENNVLGYYTLTSESLGRDMIPEKYLKQLPVSYNAPVILLGRLARDIKSKGSGLGEILLIDALLRSYTLSNESIGAMAVVVDPINEKAKLFYQKYGFQTLPNSGKMFLPMKVIGQLIP
ncbi:MAG TPA: GNAT family N-acetyltransferase [Bacteroidetes bacterium]|nr:GNAT family N-acetyltransferase [Bacteroidota bacterium]